MQENAPRGTVPYGAEYTASDTEGDTLTWSLGGPDSASFLVSSSGQLSTNADMDHEEKSIHHLTLTVDDGNGGTDSVDFTVTVFDWPEPPGPPVGITVASVSSTSLRVSWAAPDMTGKADDYDLRYRVAGSGYWEEYLMGYGAPGGYTETEINMRRLDSNTSYEIQLRTSNSEGTGPWSASATGRTGVNSPPVIGGPGTVSITVSENVIPGDIHSFTTTDPDGDRVIYKVEDDYDDLFAIDTFHRLRTSVGTFDYEATPSYRFVVTASDPHGGEDSVTMNVNVADVDEPPSMIYEVTVSAASSSSLNVSWAAPMYDTLKPPVNGYDVQYRVWPSSWIYHPHSGTDTSTTINGLTESTEYQVQVRAVNHEGNARWSNIGVGSTSSGTSSGPGQETSVPDQEPATQAIADVRVSHPTTATVGDTVVVTVSATGDVATSGKPYRWVRTSNGKDWRTSSSSRTFQGWPASPGTRSWEVFVTGTDGVEYSSGQFSITWEDPPQPESPAIANVSVSHPATATVGDTVVVTVAVKGDVAASGKPYRWVRLSNGNDWRTGSSSRTFQGWPTSPGTRSWEVFVTGSDGVEYGSGQFSIQWVNSGSFNCCVVGR